MALIYGIDPEKPFTPEDVRDAIVECFTQAHSCELDSLVKVEDGSCSKEVEEMKRLNIKQMIRSYFEKADGDFEKPTKESILLVMDKLREFSETFRDPAVIAKHYSQIKNLVDKL